jgi:hypothetical protein
MRALIWAVVLLLPELALAQRPIATIPGAFRDLDFGVVLPGVPEVVTPSDPRAGQWVFKGPAGAAVAITFTSLPGFLVNGGQTLAVTFGPASASWNTVNDPSTAQPFDPAVGTAAVFGRPPNRVYVWLGGTATPAPAIAPGTYESTYTVDVSRVP